MRGTYTPNLVILALSILKLLQQQDLDRWNDWQTDGRSTLWRQFHERCLHTKFGDSSSSLSRVIVVMLFIWWNSQSGPLWPWKCVKVRHIQSQAGFPWEVPAHQIWWSLSLFPSQVVNCGNESWMVGRAVRQTDGRDYDDNTRPPKFWPRGKKNVNERYSYMLLYDYQEVLIANKHNQW